MRKALITKVGNFDFLKTIDDNNVERISLLVLKISFLTLFGCGVKITPD